MKHAHFEKKLVYVITAWIRDFEESGYLEPSENFYRPTWKEAQALREELLESDEYSEVWISSTREEVELLV